MYLNFLPGNTFSTVDQLVERQTSNPEVQGVQGSIPAWENQNLSKKFPRVGGFSFMVIWNSRVLYIKDLIVFCFGHDFVFKSISAPCDTQCSDDSACTVYFQGKLENR